MESKIAKIGFEIEGEMSDDVKTYLEQYGEIKGDGSVNNCSNERCRRLDACEFASDPFAIGDLDTVEKIFKRLKKFADDREFHYNDTCGFHIHISFDGNKIPPEIFAEQFARKFKKGIQNTFPSVYDKRKNNHYCRYVVSSTDLLRNEHTTRYRFINFWDAMSAHDTIEVRAWPSDDPSAMAKYLKFTLRNIGDHLRNHRIRQRVNCSIDLETAQNLAVDYNATVNPFVANY